MSVFFDLIIVTCLFATAAPAVILLWHRYRNKKSWEARHRRLSLTGALLLLFGTFVLLYGSFIEPNLLITNEQTIDIDGIDTSITIVFMADFQVGPYKKEDHIKRIVERTLRLNPDLVLIGGDQIDNSLSGLDEISYLAPLEKLAKKIPTFAINGNHEYGVTKKQLEKGRTSHLPNLSKETRSAMEALGVRYLVNEVEAISTTGGQFYLFGGDSLAYGVLDFGILNTRTSTIPTIALIHTPEAVFEASEHNIDLQLSGHTHGGQIRLPFIGPVGRVESQIPKSWYQGLNKYYGMQLFVTSGTGETGARARLFNPPEIVLLTIK
jgi:uncharacterized protein